MEIASEEPVTRVLKVVQCPSVSERSQIIYQIGCRDGNAPYLRVCANSGKGAFSKDWVATADIAGVISTTEKVTAAGLSKALYPGKSTNSGGFLLAVLKDLGLIEVVGDKVKTYVQKDAAGFVAEVRQLLDAGVDLPLDARPGEEAKPEKPVKSGGRIKKVAQAPWATE